LLCLTRNLFNHVQKHTLLLPIDSFYFPLCHNSLQVLRFVVQRSRFCCFMQSLLAIRKFLFLHLKLISFAFKLLHLEILKSRMSSV
jgi:hypothetical protein